MSRLAGVSAREVVRLAESLGWIEVRRRGSHRVFVREGEPRPLTIPGHRELRPGTLRTIISTLDLSVDEFLARLGR